MTDDEPLFTSPPEERAASLRRPPQTGLQTQQVPSTFGAPPMGEPSEPSAHPDNIFAATQSLTRSSEPAPAAAVGGGGLGRQPSGSFPKASGGGLGRQPSGSFDKAAALGGGGGGGLARQPSGSLGGLRRQPSGAYDAATASKTDKSFFSHTPTAPGTATTPGTQPGLVPPAPASTTPAPTTIPVGNAPSSPYTKTEEVPPSGTSEFSAYAVTLEIFEVSHVDMYYSESDPSDGGFLQKLTIAMFISRPNERGSGEFQQIYVESRRNSRKHLESQ